MEMLMDYVGNEQPLEIGKGELEEIRILKAF